MNGEAAELLKRQPWKGNVRELRNFIYRLALLAREDTIDVAAIEALLAPARSEDVVVAEVDPGLDAAVNRWLSETRPAPGAIYDSALAAFERPLFTEVLRSTGGNQLRAAQLLGINRNTLRKRLGELSLDPELYHVR